MVLSDGIRLVAHEVHLMLIVILGHGGALGTSEEVHELLLGEVDVIVPVRVRELCWVPPVILIPGVGAQTVAMSPGLELEIGDGTTAVEVRDLHGSSVGLVVDGLGASVPLLLLLESLKNVIGANLHDGDLLVHALVAAVGGGASLELTDFTVATTGDHVWHQSHVLGVLHDW